MQDRVSALIPHLRASKPGILSVAVGTFSWRASPTIGNASMDDTDVASTFLITTDGETYSCLSILTFII
jgi:hypothetical protein